LFETILAAAALCASPENPRPHNDATVHADVASARKAAARSGRPLLIMVGASWCVPCQRAKVFYPTLRLRGEFIAMDIDGDDVGGYAVKTIPMLIVYERDGTGGWKPPRRYLGFDAVAAFVKEPIKQPAF
jgi:hypothetical protein